jgi:hypothetical protein
VAQSGWPEARGVTAVAWIDGGDGDLKQGRCRGRWAGIGPKAEWVGRARLDRY